MSENNREQISALIDNESGHESSSVLQKVAENDEYRQVWVRYHLIRDCLRQNLPDRVDLDLANRVKKAIQSEPTVLAPSSHSSHYLKPVMGFAIAASVAVVAILGIQQTSQTPSLSVPSQQIAKQSSVSTEQQLASNIVEQEKTLPVQQLPASANIDAGSRLNRYLVNYNEYRANAGMQGMLPYVRIVSYETDEQK